MATHVYNNAKGIILNAFLSGSSSLRLALLSTNTTADTENDAKVFVSDLGTLDEFDGANYVRKTLASAAVAVDDANDRAGLDFADVTWTALGAGTRSVQGVLLYDHVSTDANSKLVAWLEFSSNKVPDGSDFTIQIADLLRAA